MGIRIKPDAPNMESLTNATVPQESESHPGHHVPKGGQHEQKMASEEGDAEDGQASESPGFGRSRPSENPPCFTTRPLCRWAMRFRSAISKRSSDWQIGKIDAFGVMAHTRTIKDAEALGLSRWTPNPSGSSAQNQRRRGVIPLRYVF